METQHFVNKTLRKQKIKTFFLIALIALNVKWLPRFNAVLVPYQLKRYFKHFFNVFVDVFKHKLFTDQLDDSDSNVTFFHQQNFFFVFFKLLVNFRYWTTFLFNAFIPQQLPLFSIKIGSSRQEVLLKSCSFIQLIEKPSFGNCYVAVLF